MSSFVYCDFFYTGMHNDREIDLHSLASEEDYHEIRGDGHYPVENGHYTRENRLYTSDSGHITSDNDPYLPISDNEHYHHDGEPRHLVNGGNHIHEDHHENSFSTILSSRPMSISESIQEPLDPDEVFYYLVY